MMTDRNAMKINELLLKAGNDTCADCGLESPEYGSYNLGIFLCTTCATFHQKIGAHVSKVKSLTLAKWNDDQTQAMESLGNLEARKKYEKYVPQCYRRPKHGDPSLLLEQWIRAKYERMEFIHVDEQKYTRDTFEDTLLVKRRKDDTSYTPKIFILSQKSSTLSIFSKEDHVQSKIYSISKYKKELMLKDSKEPKICIPISRVNVCLAPAKMNRDNSMQIAFIDDGVTRNVFVTHDSGRIIWDWYMAIRNAKLSALMVAYPAAKVPELLPYLSSDFPMEGWVSKTGPSESDAYRKRWVTLDERKLMYFLNPLDEFPRGEIFLGHKDDSFDVKEGACVGCKEMGYVFSVITPERTFVFSVASSQERNDWIRVIRSVMEKPLGILDNQNRLLLDYSKKRASRHSWFHF